MTDLAQDIIDVAASLPPPSTVEDMPTILVHLDTDTCRLSYKPKDVKGARWRSNFKTLPEISTDADEQIGEGPRVIEFVERM